MANPEQEMGMDSGPGAMESKAVDQGAEGGKEPKVNLPKGEANPYKRYILPPDQREEHTKARNKNEGVRGRSLMDMVEKDKAAAVSSDPQLRGRLQAEAALSEQTKTTQRELAERQKELLKQWEQQNPVAAALSRQADDHHAKQSKGSPLKAITSGARFATGPQAALAYSTLFRNEAAMNNNLRDQINQKMVGIAAMREQKQAEKQAQWAREQEDFDKNFGQLIQDVNSSAMVDEAQKELMAQEWKQKMAQLNQLKNQNPPGISAEEFTLQKNQLMGNAKNYQQAVNNLTSAAAQWEEDKRNGLISDANPLANRDILNTLSKNGGKNIVMSENGPVINSGMTITNVNGQPTLVGYTDGQVAELQKFYNEDVENGVIDGQKTSFDQWMSNTAPPIGSENWGALDDSDPRQKAMRGVSIPVSNLANGDGVPKVIKKDPSFMQNIDTYVGKLQDDKELMLNQFGVVDQTKSWPKLEVRANEYAKQMLDSAGPDQWRSIAADALGIDFDEYEALIKDPAVGEKGIKAHLQQAIVDDMKDRLVPETDIKKHRSLEDTNTITRAKGRQTNADKERAVNQAAFDAYLQSGDIADLSGVLKGIEHKPAEEGSWFFNMGAQDESLKIKKPDGSVLDLSKMEPEQQKRVLAQTLGLIYEPTSATTGSGGSNENPKMADIEI